MTLDEVIQKYIALRDQKTDIEREMKEKVAEIKAKMDKIEVKLLEKFQALGTDSMKTKSGTAFTSRKTSATIADAEAFFQYVKENEEWGLADIRANKTAVAQYKEEHGDIPVGVNWREEITVSIRRS